MVMSDDYVEFLEEESYDSVHDFDEVYFPRSPYFQTIDKYSQKLLLDTAEFRTMFDRLLEITESTED
jgi:hypothetical protein